MFRIEMISAIFLLMIWDTTFIYGQIGTSKPTLFTWEGALEGNQAVWKVDDTLNVYKNLDGIDVTLKLLDPLNINTCTKNPSEFNDFTKTNTFFNKGNLAFQLTSSQKTQGACLEFSFSKPVFLNEYQIWDIDMLQSSPKAASSYQDSISMVARSKKGNVPLSLLALDDSPSYTIHKQSAKAKFIPHTNGDLIHNNVKGGLFISSVEPIETLTLCYSNGSEDDGLSNSHAIKITKFYFSELLGGISGTVLNKDTGLPLSGSVIKLLDQNGNLVENKHGWAMQIMTDASGQYHFGHLPMGNYTVVQINPPGFDSVNDSDGKNDDQITIELDAINTFSNNNDFFEVLNSPLPVMLVSFRAYVDQDHQIITDWKVLTEINCSHYEIVILNSENIILSNEIMNFDLGMNGNYSKSIDYNGVNQRLHVKLLQYDLDGRMNHLGTQVIYLDNKSTNLAFYPNPTNNLVFIKNNSESLFLKTKIIDTQGKEIMVLEGLIDHIDLSHLTKGTYFIQCLSPTEKIIHKILKE
jgi:hypothetical protein